MPRRDRTRLISAKRSGDSVRIVPPFPILHAAVCTNSRKPLRTSPFRVPSYPFRAGPADGIPLSRASRAASDPDCVNKITSRTKSQCAEPFAAGILMVFVSGVVRSARSVRSDRSPVPPRSPAMVVRTITCDRPAAAERSPSKLSRAETSRRNGSRSRGPRHPSRQGQEPL